jgi:hypothetical protein
MRSVDSLTCASRNPPWCDIGRCNFARLSTRDRGAFLISRRPTRANLAHGKFFKTPERTDAAREVLLELRAVLTLREELAEVINGAITRAG